MSRLISSLLVATALFASAATASASIRWEDRQDVYGGYEPGTTDAARFFWDRMNRH